MYISLWENSRGHPDNVSFMQFSTKIDGFEQKDSQGFENSYNSYEQYPLEKFFIFTIYQNYTLALTVVFLIINQNTETNAPYRHLMNYYHYGISDLSVFDGHQAKQRLSLCVISHVALKLLGLVEPLSQLFPLLQGILLLPVRINNLASLSPDINCIPTPNAPTPLHQE